MLRNNEFEFSTLSNFKPETIGDCLVRQIPVSGMLFVNSDTGWIYEIVGSFISDAPQSHGIKVIRVKFHEKGIEDKLTNMVLATRLSDVLV